jgi:hypothetical protein
LRQKGAANGRPLVRTEALVGVVYIMSIPPMPPPGMWAWPSSFFYGASATPPKPVNNPPVINTVAAQTVTVGQTMTFNVTGSDPDAGDTITYSATGLPAGATFNASTQTFAWTPTSSKTGTFNVTFTVSDGMLSDSEIVPITVQTSNQPPVLTAIGNKSVSEAQTLSFTITGNVTAVAEYVPSTVTLNVQACDT